MLHLGYFWLDLTDWTLWASVTVGIAATAAVIMFAVYYRRWRWRRRLASTSAEEDIPWDQLLDLLQKRNSERAVAGLPPDDDLPSDEVLKELLSSLPYRRRAKPTPSSQEQEFGVGGVERRTGNRRWGNPTDVHLTSHLWPGQLHGLVINRSTGGLAILVDREATAGARLRVRAVEAPRYVPTTEIEVRYCRRVGWNYVAGCQFCGDVPWNVRVWFG